MEDPFISIKFHNVSKKFKKGRRLYLKQALLDIFKPKTENFWALKNINLEIKRGESVGIIGANGSGKSTLLKLIAGVMVPTTGSVEISGKISPLIELGAGFHPELTGRENIYLNGIILGLSKKEIQEKFAEIVRFSELEDFIDTPVKHYSSGMYMRLGFSIAAHSKPDIILIDEIFAVGDDRFQKKCMERMKKFYQNGVTIILVTHSLETVAKFCRRVILLESGKILDDGKPDQIIKRYKMKYK